MPDPLIQVKVHEPAGTIILNRPDKRNALSQGMIAGLVEALDDLHHQRRVRAVILTASGSAFCAGGDLAEMARTGKRDDALEQWHEHAVRLRDLYKKMLRFPKPIIAAVGGPAVAGGAGLVLASDIVVASPEAKFGLPEPRHGLVGGMISPLLVFRVGGSWAARLVLSAETIDADQARRIGVFHEIVPGDLLWARAHELSSQCARSAAEALLMAKRMLNETIGEHLLTLLSAGAALTATSQTTDAAEEGIAAFLEKRKPDWN